MLYSLNPYTQPVSRGIQLLPCARATSRAQTRAAVLQELKSLLEDSAALEAVLSDVVMMQMEISTLKADTALERGLIEKEVRDGKNAVKKLAAQLKRQELRKAQQQKHEAEALTQAKKVQEKQDAQAKKARDSDKAACVFRAVKTGVLPGTEDPNLRAQAVKAMVEAKKKQMAEDKEVDALIKLLATQATQLDASGLNGQARRAGEFAGFLTSKIFSSEQLCFLKFEQSSTEIPTGLLVRFHKEERIGTKGFRLEHVAGQYRLSCFLYKGEKVPFSSPLTTLETIVSWLDRQDFVDACNDYFEYEVTGPCIETNARDIATEFAIIRGDPAFAKLRMREHGKIDCFDLDVYELTARNSSGQKKVLTCSTIQLVVWFLLGKIHALAKTVDGSLFR
jgi:hypothetical protein